MKQLSKIIMYFLVIALGIIIVYQFSLSSLVAQNPTKNAQATVQTISDANTIIKFNQEHYLKQYPVKNISGKKRFKPIFHYSNVDISNYYNGNKVWGAITVFSVDQKIVFCLDPYIPLNPSVYNDNYQNNTFGNLSSNQQKQIEKIIELSLYNYQLTNNMDYLFAGQILIYQQIDPHAFKLHLNDSIDRTPIQYEINELANQLQHFTDIPSFMGENSPKKHTLRWNSNKKEYEIYLTDDNNALDRFNQYAKHGAYTITKIDNKTIRISTKDHDAGLSPIIKDQFDLITDQKSYLYQGGQSVINTNAPAIVMQMQVDINPVTGNGRLTKVTNDNQPLAGAKFGLFSDADATNLIKSAISNEKGEIEFNNLIPGKYYLQEITAPKGYVGDQKIYPVLINANQTTTWPQIMNSPIMGQVELIKIGSQNDVINAETTNKLAGAEFTIYDENNKVVTKLITDEKGYAKSPKINFGNYTLVETKAPDGYIIDPTRYHFTISDNNQVVKINNGNPIVNQGISGYAIGQKKLDSNQTINGEYQKDKVTEVEYTLFDENNKALEVIHPDVTGIWQTSRLKAGNYYIKETKTLPGFVLDPNKYNFSITKNNQIIKINNGIPITNNLIRGRAIGQKKGINYQNQQINLANCEFVLFQDRDNDGVYEHQVQSYLSDENGKFATDWLAPGSYLITEVNAPDFYQPNYSEKFTISTNNQVINLNNSQAIINYPIWQQIKVIKKGATAENPNKLIGLEGVKYAIYHDTNQNQQYDNQDQEISRITTDNKGIATTGLLNSSQDKYFIREISPAPGYILDETVYPFNFDPNNATMVIENKLVQQSTFQFENKLIRGGFELTKLGENLNQEQEELANVGFDLYRDTNYNQHLDKEDQKLKTYYTDKEGKISEQNLTFGDYLLVESKQLENYLLDDHVYPFRISKNHEITHINNNKPIVNKLIRNNLAILKTDEKNNQRLNGAEFKVYRVVDQNVNLPETLDVATELINDQQIKINNQLLKIEPLTTVKTNHQGTANITNITNGTYIIIETKAPKGYQKSQNAYSIKLAETKSNQTISINIENQKITNKVAINKIDGNDNQQLKGAKLSLYKNNQVIKKWETTGKPRVFNLDYGNYKVCETKAPVGYQRKYKCQNFTVKEAGIQQEIMMKNYKFNKLFKTGIFVIKNGVLIIMLLILVIFLRRRLN